ncbi:hypothetical protein [Sphingomonas sp. T9W2]|uniref:hypothetical protein n=1 Tax=Sphingomonas sp. T9W2 TaxID=3143183 RepID=UPI0031F4B2D7
MADLSFMSQDDREHMEGYFDGHDPDCPEPSANRSWCYRHSFAIGRRELERRHPIPAQQARAMAAVASAKDHFA